LLTVLGAITLLAILIRVPSIAEPLGIDQSFWASTARGLSRGQLLYRDLWDHKPPGTPLMYLAAFSAFGWLPASIAWMDILASAATALLLFAVVRRLADNTAGAASAALYAVLTNPASLYGHGGILERSVAETFIVVLVTAAAWFATGLRERPSGRLAFGLGLCAGTAVAFKPNAALYLPALLIWVIVARAAMRASEAGAAARETRDQAIRIVAFAALGSVVAPGLIVAWLWRQGVASDAWVALVAFNRFYVGDGFSLPRYSVDFAKAVWLRIKTDPLWAIGAVASLAAIWDLVRTRKFDPLPILAILWGAAAAGVIAVNGVWLFNTYFIQALAPLAALGSWLLAVAVRRRPGMRAAACVAAGLALLLLVRRDLPARVAAAVTADMAAMTGTMERGEYLRRFGGYANSRGYSALANEELAAYVRARTDPDESIFLFGINGAGVYYAADRRVAQRFLRVNFYVPSRFGYPGFDLAAVTGELAAVRPRYVIFEELHARSAMGRAVDGLQQLPDVVRLLGSYRLDARIEDFTLYRRVD
jgi:hypothetical protein